MTRQNKNQLIAPISVIIPCYCCTTTIKRAVQSVAAQSIRPTEIILIDDRSNDETLSMLFELRDIYGDWIVVETLPQNMGAASARNRGWELATQPYIAFLDSDDAWHKLKIETQYEFMEKNPWIVMTGHSHKRLSHLDVPLDWPLPEATSYQISKQRILVSNQFITPSIMLRKDIPFRFSENKRHMEDHLLWEKIVLSGLPVVKISSQLAAIYKFSYGISGLSGQAFQMQLAEIENYRELHREKFISYAAMIALISFSMIKAIKRILIITLHKASSFIRNIHFDKQA